MRISVFPYQQYYSSLLLVDVANSMVANHAKSVRVCQFVHTSRIRYNKLASEPQGFRILVRNMSTLKVKIDNRAGGSGATPQNWWRT